MQHIVFYGVAVRCNCFSLLIDSTNRTGYKLSNTILGFDSCARGSWFAKFVCASENAMKALCHGTDSCKIYIVRICTFKLLYISAELARPWPILWGGEIM